MDMKFLLYSWLDSYHKNITSIHKIIISTLRACTHTSHEASVHENLIRELFH